MPFKLIKRHGINNIMSKVESAETMNIPFAFRTGIIGIFEAKIVIRNIQKNIEWVYPIVGISQFI